MTYDIIKEVEYENKFYYVEANGLLLQARGDLPLPNHPILDYKRFNQKEKFIIIEKPPIGLEAKVK